MARESREVWVKRVERWRESGLSANEFAAELGVNAATLAQWKYRLAAEARAEMPSETTLDPAAVSFVEVNAAVEPVAAERPAAQSTFDVVLLNGITVRVPSQFDAVALRRLVDVMTAR
jgi:transcriptional regulator with XRE-family HTH domain